MSTKVAPLLANVRKGDLLAVYRPRFEKQTAHRYKVTKVTPSGRVNCVDTNDPEETKSFTPQGLEYGMIAKRRNGWRSSIVKARPWTAEDETAHIKRKQAQTLFTTIDQLRYAVDGMSEGEITALIDYLGKNEIVTKYVSTPAQPNPEGDGN